MNKRELVEYIASYSDLDQPKAAQALEAVVMAISDALAADEQVVLTGLGTFFLRDRISRTATSTTGEEIDLRSKKIVHFRPASALDQAVSAADQTNLENIKVNF
jgi:DNA-binding protein HU-beta